MHVAIVCGYGLYDPAVRTPEEMEGLQEYLTAVFQDIQRRPEITTIVLCGGCTNPLRPQVSEAKSVMENWVLKQTVFDPREYRWALEEASANAAQSLSFAAMLLLYHLPQKCTVYCDTVREWKTRILAKQILGNLGYAYEVVGFPRRDIHPRSTWGMQIAQGIRCLVSPEYVRSLLMAEPAHPPSP
ncbi:MAG: hypothetical protein WCV85_06185 [Patescibacteria group bacterium]|jgi:hypothetical protein